MAQDRSFDGWFFEAQVRGGLTAGTFSARSQDQAQSDAFAGGGLWLGFGTGHALSSDLALGLDIGTGLAAYFKSARFPFSNVSFGLPLTGLLMIHHAAGGARYFAGAGAEVGLPSGGRSDVGSPDNITSFDPTYGPAVAAGLSWSLSDAVPLDFGLRIDAAYLIKSGRTTWVPIRVSASLGLLLF